MKHKDDNWNIGYHNGDGEWNDGGGKNKESE